MRITIRAYGNIAKVIGNRNEVQVHDNATLRTLLEKLGEQKGQNQGYLGEYRISGNDLAIILNGKNVEALKRASTPIRDGDEVVIVQPTAGG